MEHSLQEKYYQLLTSYVAQPQKKYLAEAAELGRELGLAEVPPEELGELHEKTIEGLAPAFPDIEPLEVVRIVSTPMTEVLTAYGLAFRRRHERLGNGAEAALNQRVQELNSLNTLSRHVSANLPLDRVVQAAPMVSPRPLPRTW